MENTVIIMMWFMGLVGYMVMELIYRPLSLPVGILLVLVGYFLGKRIAQKKPSKIK